MGEKRKIEDISLKGANKMPKKDIFDLNLVDSFPIHDSQGEMTMAVTKGNKILITYGSQDCVRMYDFEGREIHVYSAENLGLSHFFPSDTCIRPSDGQIVVTTGVCSRVHYFNEVKDNIELEKEEKVPIEDAQKIAVMANNDVIICGYKFKQEIKLLSDNEEAEQDLRIPNNGLPSYVTADGNFPLYIALKDQNRVAQFDEELGITFRGSGFGSRKGQFIGIGGLCVDKKHNLLVADEGNNRLQKMDSNGKWCVLKINDYKLKNPLDLDWRDNGDLVVLTRRSIVLFRYSDHDDIEKE